jgi:hypothetical protein
MGALKNYGIVTESDWLWFILHRQSDDIER